MVRDLGLSHLKAVLELADADPPVPLAGRHAEVRQVAAGPPRGRRLGHDPEHPHPDRSDIALPRATRRETRSSSWVVLSPSGLLPDLSSMTSNSCRTLAFTSYSTGFRARTKALAIGTCLSTSTSFWLPNPAIISGS